MAWTILLAVDGAAIRTALKTYLPAQACSAVQVLDGESALAALRQREFHVVVADVALPRLGGLALTRAIREDPNPEVRKLPVVLLTGDRWGLMDSQAEQAGASALVRKPVSGADLAKEIARHLPAVAPYPW